MPQAACSSLDDGPFCEGFGPLALMTSSAEEVDNRIFVDDVSESARFVVDGVLFSKLRARNQEAFDWSAETLRTFSTLVSRVILEAVRPPVVGSSSGVRFAHDPSAEQTAQMKQMMIPVKSVTKCFRLAFDRLPFGQNDVPFGFSAGLPAAFSVNWEGDWKVDVVSRLPVHNQPRRSPRVNDVPPWRTRAVLRSALGYLRFAQPVVVRRFVIGVPLMRDRVHGDQNPATWGKNGLVCGRLEGKEQWCSSLAKTAASASSDDYGLDDVVGGLPLLLVDVSNSILAVDEIALICIPKDGIRVAMLEIGATPPSDPSQSTQPSKRRVVMLRRPRGDGAVPSLGGDDTGSSDGLMDQLEPVLATVSLDAALWDLNDLIRHNMQLRGPVIDRAFVGPLEGIQGRPTITLKNFQTMLRDLKAKTFIPPQGITQERIKRELAAMVSSTNVMKDEEVLVHSQVESLLHQRLWSNSLDGLIVLHALWQDTVGKGGVSGADVSVSDRNPKVIATGVPLGQELREGNSDDSHADTVRVERSQIEGHTPPDEGVDAALSAMTRTSSSLKENELDTHERRDQEKAQGNFELQMDFDKATLDVKVVERGNSMTGLASMRESRPAFDATHHSGEVEETNTFP
eukprot:TRINITY_DN55782_c0_g1_i1.p1 TRINITY_DN55782_c0_g1~~TRINITY_DN55782_c0_g1_i1.p1  ORF type:complete len:736 (+),score=96.46 TRINITY_DN55782_c0_g1_i1:330-2210(+)